MIIVDYINCICIALFEKTSCQIVYGNACKEALDHVIHYIVLHISYNA